MGVFAGPDISESGLVLALDAGNLKSYDFTENLTPYSAARISPNNWTEATSNTTYQQLDLNALGRFPGVLVTSTTGQAWHRRGTGYTQSFVSGTTYTLTYFYRAGSTGNARLQVRINSVESLLQGPVNGSNWTVQQTAGTITNISTTLLEDGLTYKTSYTLTSNQTGTVSIAIGIGSNDVGGTVIALGVQLEERDFATDYYETTGTPKTKSTSFIDISNNSNNGTLTNGPTYSSDNGGSLVFDGVNDNISISYDASLKPTTAITMEAFCYIQNNGTSWASLIQYPQNSSSHTPPYFDWAIYLNMSSRYLHTRIDGEQANSPNNVWNFNEWLHVAITFENQSVKYYVNGNNVGSSSVTKTSITYDADNPVYIGKNASGSEPFEGLLSNIKVYNKALTASEIQQNFNATRSRFGI